VAKSPRGSKMTDDQRAALIVLLALGVCGWSMVIGLLLVLEERKVVSRKQGRRVLAEAAEAVRSMDDLGTHPALRIALDILEGELNGWVTPTE
jgi:hypothetical protein